MSEEKFTENYQKLQMIAQKLSSAGEVDIDELIPMVDEASQAYQICKSRLEAVEKALSERLDDTESETGESVINPDSDNNNSSQVPF